MALSEVVIERLSRIGPFRGRHEKLAIEKDGVRVEVDLKDVDELGCRFDVLRLSASVMQGASMDALRAWADRISRRVTYLLERVEPIEVDAGEGKVLLRSTPPEKRGSHTSYYEVVLDASGSLRLQRFQNGADMPRRAAVPCTCTREQIEKLVDDLAASVG